MKYLNSFFESSHDESYLVKRLQEIDKFDKYLLELPSHTKYISDRPSDPNTTLTGFKSFWDKRKKFGLDDESLYTISKSKRHNFELMNIIEDILTDLVDDDIIKLISIAPSYDLNIKDGDKLVPRFVIQYRVLPKVDWKSTPEISINNIKSDKPADMIVSGKTVYYNPAYSKYEMLLAYGLKITHVTSTKISLSQI